MGGEILKKYIGNFGVGATSWNNSVTRVPTKYPKSREKLENRELEFLYIKNLDIKVKDHDFEI